MSLSLMTTCRFLTVLFLSANFLNGSIHDEEIRVPMGTESISEEERILFAEAQTSEDEEEYLSQERIVRDPFYPVDYSLYTVRSIGYKQRTVTLHDKSIWVVRPADAKILEKWIDEYKSSVYPGQAPSNVYVTPNTNWFFDRDYEFRMVNKDTGAFIYCDIAEPPVDALVNQILQIDRHSKEIIIMNSSGMTARFSLFTRDSSVYKDWTPGHYIMIGRNSRWGSSSNPYLLYNLSKDSMSRASNLN